MNLKTVYFSTLLFNSIAVAIVIFLGIREDNVFEHIGERGFLTSISVAQLLIISLLSLTIFLILYKNWKNNFNQSQPSNNRFFWQNSFTIWAIASAGFLFLAIDERYKIHELTDQRIHEFFKIQETGVTDRIDDLIVGLYALIGIAILYMYREELKRHRQAFVFMKYALAMVFVMIIIDIISNRGDIVQLFINDSSLLSIIITWLSIIEESLKIFAEGYFLIGFYSVFLNSRKIKPKIVS